MNRREWTGAAFRGPAVLALLLVLAGLAGAVAPARAALRLDRWRDHLAVGFAKVYSDTLAPSGNISAAGGVEYPLGERWRLGPEVAFNLLGSSSADRGSVRAGLDYSMFDAALLLTWLPPRGPVARLSAGPGIASARAELSVAGGGLLFRDLPVGEVKPSFAAEATFMSRHYKFVGIGAELGTRIVPVSQGTWTLLTARLAIHY